MFNINLRSALIEIGVECVRCKKENGIDYQDSSEYKSLRKMRDLILEQIRKNHKGKFRKSHGIRT
jgi:hypothetical protein